MNKLLVPSPRCICGRILDKWANRGDFSEIVHGQEEDVAACIPRDYSSQSMPLCRLLDQSINFRRELKSPMSYACRPCVLGDDIGHALVEATATPTPNPPASRKQGVSDVFSTCPLEPKFREITQI